MYTFYQVTKTYDVRVQSARNQYREYYVNLKTSETDSDKKIIDFK